MQRITPDYNIYMKHDAFIKEYDWKPYNYDQVFWPECVDLFKGYYRDVKDYRINVSLGTAKNYWTSIEKAGFTRTKYPVEGDAAFSTYLDMGHVGIFIRFWTSKWVEGWYQFDQLWNGEKVWGEKPCKIRFYPMSKLLWFATINKPMNHILQFGEKDCSLTSTINCIILNNPELAKVFTQELVNKLMPEYINKNPRDAYKFLKGKGYDIKLIPLDFEKAKIRMKKGSAVLLFIKWETPASSHWTCMKLVEWKYTLYDSTRPDVVVIPDIDTPYSQGVFTDSCFQVR